MTTSQVQTLVDRVTDYIIANPFERDSWEKSPAITGILAWNDVTAVEAVRKWIDRAVALQSTEGYLSYSERLEFPHGHAKTFAQTGSLSASLGFPLLDFYQRTQEARYLEAAKLQLDAVLRAPRTRDGGLSCRFEAPELWVDFIYLIAPFIARYGVVAEKPEYVDEAFNQFAVHAKHLVDPFAGLARHAWCETPNHFPQSTLWARGNGWLVCAAVDLLEIAPKHVSFKLVAETGRVALEAMRSFQDRSGYMRHILDDRFAKFEASSTVMFAYAAAKAFRLGLVGSDMVDSAKRAWRIVAESIGEDGAVPGVAVPPGGPGVPFGSTLFGQGFFLLAAHELREHLN